DQQRNKNGNGGVDQGDVSGGGGERCIVEQRIEGGHTEGGQCHHGAQVLTNNLPVTPHPGPTERQQNGQGNDPAPERHGQGWNMLHGAPGHHGVAGPEQRGQNQTDVGQARDSGQDSGVVRSHTYSPGVGASNA